MVAHPSINRAWRRVTSLICPMTLPLRHAATWHSLLLAVHKQLNWSRCHLGCGLGWCTLAPPGEYDWKVYVRQPDVRLLWPLVVVHDVANNRCLDVDFRNNSLGMSLLCVYWNAVFNSNISVFNSEKCTSLAKLVQVWMIFVINNCFFVSVRVCVCLHMIVLRWISDAAVPAGLNYLGIEALQQVFCYYLARS